MNLPPTIWLLRHGQTEWNVAERAQGRLDSPLTAVGQAQASHYADLLAPVPLLRAYTSPLGRARQTAEQVCLGRDLPLTVLDDLSELDFGEAAGLTPSERESRFPGLSAMRAADKYHVRLPSGESYASARPRAERALARIAADGPGDVLVVTHEMLGRLLRQARCGLTDEEALWLSHPHGEVYRIGAGAETTFGAADRV